MHGAHWPSASRPAERGEDGELRPSRLDADGSLAWHPRGEAPLPAPPASPEEDRARKQARREAKLLAQTARLLDPWERYRALTDAVEEGIDLAEMADRKVRFALVVMSGVLTIVNVN